MNILLIDNYDSFTYNIVQILKENCGCEVDVEKNDAIPLEDIEPYDKIVISPGPGLPEESGIINKAIKHFAPSKTILGICLGHQAIGEVYGARLNNLEKCFHGVASDVTFKEKTPLFNHVANPFQAGRYHSWVIEKKDFPQDTLEILAYDDNDQIMAIKHKKYNTFGIQFHPESILTPDGIQILKNWTML